MINFLEASQFFCGAFFCNNCQIKTRGLVKNIKKEKK